MYVKRISQNKRIYHYLPTWTSLPCIFSEDLYKQMADRMAADGYKDVGYEYVNIDDCWAAKQRDSDGKLRADPERFPSGIKKLADYVSFKNVHDSIHRQTYSNPHTRSWLMDWQTDRRKDARMSGWIDRWMDGMVDEWIVIPGFERMDAQMEDKVKE